MLFTRRADGMRNHSGEISFPGGARDGSETPEQTALREAEEECGVSSSYIEVSGRLPAEGCRSSAHQGVPELSAAVN